MRIISDFHDYYDVGMKNGIDPKLPYKRYRCVENIESIDLDYSTLFGDNLRLFYSFSYFAYNCSPSYIGFAGKIYPVMDSSENPDQSDYFFDFEQFDDDAWLGLLEKQVKRQCQTDKRFSSAGYHREHLRREKERKEAVASFKKTMCTRFEFRNSTKLLSLFEKFKTAIFVYKLGERRIIINERLNQYNFQKVLPPMQAFQELEMYVGSYLTQPVIEEPPISDKIKAEIHGFDKYSFRKAKPSN